VLKNYLSEIGKILEKVYGCALDKYGRLPPFPSGIVPLHHPCFPFK
jgi:hypothetical protein